jgi:hypothetical protein
VQLSSLSDLVSEGAPVSTAPAVVLTVLAAAASPTTPIKRTRRIGPGGWDALGRGMLSQGSPILGRRHAHGPPERAGEARLRGKPGLKSDL